MSKLRCQKSKGLPRSHALQLRGRRPRGEVCVLWGQSMFEVIFAIAISGIILTGVVALATTSVRNTTSSQNKNLTSDYLSQTIEWLRNEKDNSWATIYNQVGLGPTYCLDDLYWTNTGACLADEDIGGNTNMYRELTLSFEDAENKIIQAIVEIERTDAQGTHIDRTIARFTNWKLAEFVTPAATATPALPPCDLTNVSCTGNICTNSASGCGCTQICQLNGYDNCLTIGTDVNGKNNTYIVGGIYPFCISSPGNCNTVMSNNSGNCTLPTLWTRCNCIIF